MTLGHGLEFWPPGVRHALIRLAHYLLDGPAVDTNTLIAVRQVESGGRLIRVQLFLNEGGSVAARCLLGGSEMPIIDAPSPEAALAAVEDALEGLLLARASPAA
jgi:hypothetical protein